MIDEHYAAEEKSKEALPKLIWEQFEAGRSYNESINLSDVVQKCEDFFIGEQWGGLQAPDLDKPVINKLKRVINFFVASIMSDDIGINLDSFDDDLKPMQVSTSYDTASGGMEVQTKYVLAMLSKQIDLSIELGKVKGLFRELLRNSAVDGAGCLHYWFDDKDTRGKRADLDTPGNIQSEVIENYNVYFGNPQCSDVEKQPYIIIEYRKPLREVRLQAKKNGIKDWESIQPDNSNRGVNTEHENGKVTVLKKYWRDEKSGTIHCADAVKDLVIMEEVDTGLKRYPLVWLPWEKVKNSYHGKSAVEVLIPTQIAINKLYAMAIQSVKQTAFPKIIYNRSMLPGGWSNRVGEAIPVSGNPEQAVAQGFRAPDMSTQLFQMIQAIENDMTETMGASDASLGNVKPDNTSAIIATQKATAMPLELQKMAFFDLVEDSVRIWLDMMSCYYGSRTVRLDLPQQPQPDVATMVQAIADPAFAAQQMPGVMPMTHPDPDATEPQDIVFDFGTLHDMDLKLNVDIGAATYWSELMQVQTLDNLYHAGIISDPEVYLDAMPSGYIKNKEEIIKAYRKAHGEMPIPTPGGNANPGAAIPEQLQNVQRTSESGVAL